MEVTCKAEEFMKHNSRHVQRLPLLYIQYPLLGLQILHGQAQTPQVSRKRERGTKTSDWYLFLWYCINPYLSHHDIHHLGPARTLKSSMAGLLLQPGSNCQACIHLQSCLLSAWNIWVSLLLQMELSQPFTTHYKVFPSLRAPALAFPDHC